MPNKFIIFFAAALFGSTIASTAHAQDQCTSASECTAGQDCITGECVESGQLSIYATWSVGADIDLHVITPSGKEISPDIADSRRADGGRMVRDDCYSGSCEGLTGQFMEQVLWDACTEPLAGRYRVWVENYDGAISAQVRLQVRMPDGELRSFGDVFVSAAERETSREITFEIEAAPDTGGECVRDTDGDGLCDDWEICGIDVDDDGEPDWKIPGADPRKKDLYVELDYQVGNDTFADGTDAIDVLRAGIADTVSAFAAAPVPGAEGEEGIALHVTLDEAFDQIAGAEITKETEVGKADLNALMFGSADVDEDSNSCGTGGFFGTEADRASVDCEKIIKAKRMVYRYGISVYSRPGTGSSGVASGIPGSAFIVSIGSWGDWSFNSDYWGGTFMHELGHTLNLRHGGDENFNCKVNYLSVMSYLYQLTGRYPGRNLDFSAEKLPDLDPTNLNEAYGVQGPESWGDVIFGYAGQLRLSGESAAGGIDYDLDGETTGEGLERNIAHFSRIGACNRSSNLDTNVGHDDWAAITYAPASFDGHLEGPSNQGDANADTEHEEMTLEEARAIEDEIDDDLDDVEGSQDNCLGIPNADQADSDGDFVGDACDACPMQAARGMGDGCPYTGALFERVDPAQTVDAPADWEAGEETDFVTPQSGGCSAAGGDAGGTLLGLLLIAGLAIVRRRR